MKEINVTVPFSVKGYEKGAIIGQRSSSITGLFDIENAIFNLSTCYVEWAEKIVEDTVFG